MTPESYGSRPGERWGGLKGSAAQRTPGAGYNTSSYRKAIWRACQSAGVPAWSPNQIRHTRLTEIRRTEGLEAAQVTAGHDRADVTQIYAERNSELAREVARKGRVAAG